MIRGFFLFLFFLLVIRANAQPGVFEEDLKDALQTRPSIFIDLQTSNSFISGRHIQIRGVKTGINFDHKLRLGIGYNWINKSFKLQQESIEESIRIRYASLNVDYKFYSKWPWSFSIPVQMDGGMNSLVSEINDVRQVESRRFFMAYEPLLVAQYHFLTYFSVSLGVGYRLMIANNRFQELNFNSPVYVLRAGIDFRKLWEDTKDK